ncbi:hypothetical protein [Candidatus Mycoplasma mahonii]|uniref:hypothetical protein n=1 Tax=Candidatus Mycoplasma mahonii TaxID=3004105 RepID=UPI0026EEE043|nr:hypothetical protein [Candidatus Mycoplasma mahonii]WKX02691.1 hypothetical protein O3I44_01285 [Candidatus Mycoplasma mahonii]
MGIKTIILMGVAAVAGIYLTSEEGKNARKSLQKKKSVLLPVVRELLNEVNSMLEGSKEIKSDEIRANIEKIVSEIKLSLINLDLEKAFETSKKAIKVASAKLNDTSNVIDRAKRNQQKALVKK